jgi:hypothetical protein
MKFAEMANLPCSTCDGTKNDEFGEPWIPEMVYSGCPDCQQDGKPTGLLLPEGVLNGRTDYPTPDNRL